jgi:hypothetical protein
MASILVERLGHFVFKTTGFASNRQPAALFEFDLFEPLPMHIEVSDAPLTPDAGLLPLRRVPRWGKGGGVPPGSISD